MLGGTDGAGGEGEAVLMFAAVVGPVLSGGCRCAASVGWR